MASPLLALPAELRLEIWRLLFHYPDYRLRPLAKVQDTPYNEPDISTRSKAIRGTCRLIRDETTPILYEFNQFHFEPDTYLGDAFAFNGYSHLIQRIQLDFCFGDLVVSRGSMGLTSHHITAYERHQNDERIAGQITGFVSLYTGYKTCTLRIIAQSLECFSTCKKTAKAIANLLSQSEGQTIELIIEITSPYQLMDDRSCLEVADFLKKVRPRRPFDMIPTWGLDRVHIKWLLGSAGSSQPEPNEPDEPDEPIPVEDDDYWQDFFNFTV